MDREYDPGNANLKKHCILQALLLVIIRFCPIYLLRYWPLFWVYLSTPNWICLPHVLFFSPTAIKISCVHCSWRFCLRKKSVANARRNDELSIPLPHSISWHFVEFFFVSPSPPKTPLARQPFVLVSLRAVVSFSLAKYVIALWLVRFTIVLDYSMHCVH